MSDAPFRAALGEGPKGLRVDLIVTAGAQAASFPDRYDAWRRRIGIRVTARAEGGRANREIVALVAAFFGRPARAVTILHGEKDSQKTLSVAGLDLEEATRRLAEAPW